SAAPNVCGQLLTCWTGVKLLSEGGSDVRAWNTGGESWCDAEVVVDASGDADVCAMAGVAYDDARSTPNLQALSTIFRVANVDVDAAAALPKQELWARMRQASES